MLPPRLLPTGTSGIEFLCGIPQCSLVPGGSIPAPLWALLESSFVLYSSIFLSIQGPSQAPVGSNGVDFSIVFLDIPLHLEAFTDPCRTLFRKGAPGDPAEGVAELLGEGEGYKLYRPDPLRA